MCLSYDLFRMTSVTVSGLDDIITAVLLYKPKGLMEKTDRSRSLPPVFEGIFSEPSQRSVDSVGKAESPRQPASPLFVDCSFSVRRTLISCFGCWFFFSVLFFSLSRTSRANCICVFFPVTQTEVETIFCLCANRVVCTGRA